jgi:outer membrane protein OmpA-like peptidoglycan-associated protein
MIMTHPSAILSRLLTLLALAAVLAACAGRPSRPPELLLLQEEYARVQSDPRIVAHAQPELDEAGRALDSLLLGGRDMSDAIFDHNIYITDRLIKIAEAEGLAGDAEARSRMLAQEREALMLDARTREADLAVARAESARHAADIARSEAAIARADADAARLQLDAMRARLVDLETRQTERGLIVTLGDVLFEVDRADLKPGAQLTLQQLVQVLRENPSAMVAVEGHTDSTGTQDYNLSLSLARANAVGTYLVSQGIARERISTRGLGQDYPVASNADAAGRQQNRRVELVIQDRPLG